MLALSTWLVSGRPWSVLAPSSVWVSTASWPWPWPLWFLLEVAGRLGEADRRLHQVVVPVVDEEEDLGGVLLAVDLPRERLVRVPGARVRVVAELHVLEVERRERVVPRAVLPAAPPRSGSPAGRRSRRSRCARCCRTASGRPARSQPFAVKSTCLLRAAVVRAREVLEGGAAAVVVLGQRAAVEELPVDGVEDGEGRALGRHRDGLPGRVAAPVGDEDDRLGAVVRTGYDGGLVAVRAGGGDGVGRRGQDAAAGASAPMPSTPVSPRWSAAGRPG